MYMKKFRTMVCVLLVAAGDGWGQTSGTAVGVVLPEGTPLPVTIRENLPMKVGTPVRAELTYAVYDHDTPVLPVGTVVLGSVVGLAADHTRRVHARLRADFTPFHVPVVRFTSIVLPNGSTVPLTTGTATDGAPVYRLVAPAPRTGSFVSRQLDAFKHGVSDRAAVITGPEKGYRFKQFLYGQLPYHPERIAKDTSWTVETAGALPLPGAPAEEVAKAALPVPDAAAKTWVLQAYLDGAISSATSKAGQGIKATVAEPILDADGKVVVPQGSVLTGAVTQARPARGFGRAGELRFSFRQLTFPGGEPQSVQVAMTGADGAGGMEMNAEGEVKPKPQDKLVVPLILIALAARPLDPDGRHQLRKDALASNSLGAIGFIVGTAAQQASLAAGIGFYGSAISIYERVLRKGKEVSFAKDTRIVLQTTARRSGPMTAEAAPQP
jgi:hypothetical protein